MGVCILNWLSDYLTIGLSASGETHNPVLNTNSTFLRIKQTLELPGMKYDYIKTFVTNVKGLDKDIEFMGTTFNFSKMHMYMPTYAFVSFVMHSSK